VTKGILIAPLLVTLGIASAHASPVPDTGWPFCTDRSELQEYFLAMIKKDTSWMNSLKTCLMAKPGLNMVTIEDFASDSDIGHVAKVRLIAARSTTSLVGYTLKLKDGPEF
jgi:hypothetical protein